MQKFIMLVGLPGSGKSTYAKDLAEHHLNSVTGTICRDDYFVYCSSDKIREEIYGDERIQGDANRVFSVMSSRVIHGLNTGYSVIYDATNIKRKDRLGILNRVKSLKMDIQCECHIVWAKIETCIERNNNRERVVPNSVIGRMLKQFETPWYDEGWDEIKIVYTDSKYDRNEIEKALSTMNHDNSHHRNDSILDHINRVRDEVVNKYTSGIDSAKLFELSCIHDYGKLYTKDFHNSKGEITEDAHYYQHQNVGAYMVLGINRYMDVIVKDSAVYMSYLTLLHMEPFFDKNPSNYWKKKVDPEIKKLIYIFNECDRKGA